MSEDEIDRITRKLRNEMYFCTLLVIVAMAIYFCIIVFELNETKEKVIDNWGYIHELSGRQLHLSVELETHDTTQAKEFKEIKEIIRGKK